MERLAALHPPLSERQPIPALYQPLTFFLTLIPFLFRKRRRTALCVLPILLASCIRAPGYTFGSPSVDYYNSSPFIAMPIWFLEFAILTPEEGPDAPRYVGNASAVTKSKETDRRWQRPKTPWEQLAWAFSLMIPSHRGIGWQWQIKNVPDDPIQHLPKWAYVQRHVRRMLVAYTRSAAMLVLLGYGSAIEERLSPDSRAVTMLVNALTGRCGATWVWDRLNCFYSLLAAASVALGICETRSWGISETHGL